MPNYPHKINSKLPNVKTTIFTTVGRMAKKYNAINLSQGFPNFECSPQLITLVEKYMRKGYNQYAPLEGIMPLREMIAEKTEDLYSYKYNQTGGGTQWREKLPMVPMKL